MLACIEIISFLAKNMATILEIISLLANMATIVALIFGIKIYFSWKKDYKLQKSHEYALSLLKNIKQLHVEIETTLKRPQFFHKKSIIEEIDKHYIPKIQERIFNRVTEIEVDLLIAENILVKNKDLQSRFNERIKKNILGRIGRAIYQFQFFCRNKKDISYEDLQKLDIWEIIFFSDKELPPDMIKQSILGIGKEVINDKFNEEIEKNFNDIYEALQENIILK